jgi:hypothetical protein
VVPKDLKVIGTFLLAVVLPPLLGLLWLVGLSIINECEESLSEIGYCIDVQWSILRGVFLIYYVLVFIVTGTGVPYKLFFQSFLSIPFSGLFYLFYSLLPVPYQFTTWGFGRYGAEVTILYSLISFVPGIVGGFVVAFVYYFISRFLRR